MIMTVTVNDMKRKFEEYDRDYFSYPGLETLLNFYNETDENREFDAEEIVGNWTEYGEGAGFTLDDLGGDYGYVYPEEEYLEDNNLEEDEFDEDSYLESLVEHLERYTMVLRASNGNYLIFAF